MKVPLVDLISIQNARLEAVKFQVSKKYYRRMSRILKRNKDEQYALRDQCLRELEGMVFNEDHITFCMNCNSCTKHFSPFKPVCYLFPLMDKLVEDSHKIKV